ncbi:hypothetical protein DENSPDRAFT_929230 [Dentipellis sp. KUC8613]|nr:hypothetical protein DENSPDRAFT_929230 [Dentipellis sp. KUC8613]
MRTVAQTRRAVFTPCRRPMRPHATQPAALMQSPADRRRGREQWSLTARRAVTTCFAAFGNETDGGKAQCSSEHVTNCSAVRVGRTKRHRGRLRQFRVTKPSRIAWRAQSSRRVRHSCCLSYRGRRLTRAVRTLQRLTRRAHAVSRQAAAGIRNTSCGAPAAI